MQQEVRSTRAISFIDFHGLTLMVVEHADIQYIEAKPLCDLAGVQWKGAQRVLENGDNALLYGVRRMDPPEIAGLGTLKCPESGVLYLRLDRSRMYMARISTDRMRANGNVTGADHVLALQQEWAAVLHRYETQGIAVKNDRVSTLRALLTLAKARDGLANPTERQAFTEVLHAEMRTLGLPLDSLPPSQPQLPLPA